MSTHDTERLWPQLVSALLSERSIEAAAARVGLARSTVSVILRHPEFQLLYRQAREDLLERMVARLLALSDKAVDALEKCLKAKGPADKTRAAVAILDRALRGVELLDLATRVAALEKSRAEANDDE